MIIKKDKNAERKRRHLRVRRKVSGTAECPRLSVYRSLTAIYCQIIDDVKGITIVSANSRDKLLEKDLAAKSKLVQAEMVGLELAKRAKAKGIKRVVFDRSGYIYTGRVKKLADACRQGGLEF